MKRPFSIRIKLMAIVMVTTCIALILAGGALALFEIDYHHRTLVKKIGTTADILAGNLTASLIFEKADSAEKALLPLDSHTEIVSACLYDVDGNLFARYQRAGNPGPCPPRPDPEINEVRGDRLVVHRPIEVSAEGTAILRLEASLHELKRRIRLFGLVLLVVLTGSALVALILSSGLQRLVSRPILDLAGTAQQISQSYDYSLRAPRRTEDEIGIAVDAFNQMVDRIGAAVSERRRAEEQLRALNATLEERVAERTAAVEEKASELKRSNDELERFASVASHDLQEPLRAVASYTQLIKERIDTTADKEMEVYLGHVLTGASRMRALISDLLNYARVGRGALARRLCDSSEVLDDSLTDLGAMIKDSGATVTRGPLPTVSADRGQLGQLFSNLISNAIRFRGEGPPQIDVRAERKGDFWHFSVRDNGIGIDPRHHDKIFIIFQRLHGRDRPGTGIGLAICRKIVDLHGGHIWVESEPGLGSTFTFTLPTGRDAESSTRPNAEATA